MSLDLHLPTPQEIRRQEPARFVLKGLKARVIFVPMVALLATLLVLLEPTPLKVELPAAGPDPAQEGGEHG